MVETPEQAIQVLGWAITPETVREVIQKARAVRWGTHLLRWRYFDVTHEGVTYHHNALIPTALWHLLKRIYVDQEWSPDATLEHLNDGARANHRTSRDRDLCLRILSDRPATAAMGVFSSDDSGCRGV